MKVLLIENNPGDASLISKFIHEKVWDVDLVIKPTLSEVLKSKKNGYEIIITNLSLPDSSGLDTLQSISNFYPTLPTIVLTSENDTKTGIEAIKIGAQDFLLKDDLNAELLSRVIKYAIERKKTEIQLKELADTKDKLFSIIAHDLKNPFLGIISYIDFFLNNYEKYQPDEILNIFRVMLDTSKGTYNMLKNLLDWARSQTGHIKLNPKECNIDSSVSDQLAVLRSSLATKKISVEIDIDSEHLVYADKPSLNVIILNLLTNAVKYTNENGKIQISTDKVGDNIRINIHDNGIGMNSEQLSSLFQLDCYSTRPGTAKERGTGLGLIVCNDFARLNQGSIKVDSTPGLGSTFSIILPAA
ncbi:MAG: response regulator [Bacteroidales bacterium]|nr:response regulator [Bacteroidales bacterium]MCF8405447.1 response regulator [Bacteroidales bacterium]